jgi:hypothetical protein
VWYLNGHLQSDSSLANRDSAWVKRLLHYKAIQTTCKTIHKRCYASDQRLAMYSGIGGATDVATSQPAVRWTEACLGGVATLVMEIGA